MSWPWGSDSIAEAGDGGCWCEEGGGGGRGWSGGGHVVVVGGDGGRGVATARPVHQLGGEVGGAVEGGWSRGRRSAQASIYQGRVAWRMVTMESS